ncbi:MAG: histidinol dehydrogenase [Sulfolobales archaeon]
MTVIKSLHELHDLRKQNLSTYLEHVKEILEHVRTYGDDGLIELTKRFDGITIRDIVVEPKELKDMAESTPDDVKTSIDLLYEYLQSLNKEVLPKDFIVRDGEYSSGIIWRPIDSVGIYVPGGLKAYPSTLLMAAVPAKVAGVERLYIGTPPRFRGEIDPAVAYISLKLKVSKVYRVGGAQIIAAMAYGTKSVDKVDKVVGPGNIYVQLAKFLLQDTISIDGVEGPTELFVIADESANPIEICLDMEAQAEHGTTTINALFTPSDELLNGVETCLKSSMNKFFLIEVENIEEAVELVNSLAPEHLSLRTRNPYSILGKIRNVGAISIGRTPSAIIDYLGPNHILPTNGSARFRGGLSVYDFIKTVMVVDGVPKPELLSAARTLANYEGFNLHGKSIGVLYGHT